MPDSKPALRFVVALAGLIALMGTVTMGCSSQGDQPAAYQPRKSPQPSSAEGFVDIARKAGLDFRMTFLTDEQGRNFKINLYDHGCGVAVGDYDGDGQDDLYFLNQLGANALFRNRGDGTFEDVTAKMGVGLADRISVAATFADYDNDGDQDLYVTSTRGGSVMFRNENNQALKDVTEEVGLQLIGHSQTAAFFDYNKDSLLDLLVVQSAEWTTETFDPISKYYAGKGRPFNGREKASTGFDNVTQSTKEQNHLYRNNGDGTFSDVTEGAGLQGLGWSSDVAVFDYDQDGWQDVFVACMFGRAQLYHNRQDGTFEDVTLDVLGRTPWGGMGVKVFDHNNDGILDILVVDMHSDMWMGMDHEQKSQTVATASEKVKFPSVFGPVPKDKMETDAFKESVRQKEDEIGFKDVDVFYGNAFYQGLGGGKFKEASKACNLETFWPWGVAVADYDNDGYEDAFITAGMGYPFYYWKNSLMMNDRQGSFRDLANELGIEPPPGGEFLTETIHGIRCVRSSRCAVTGDFDGDGRVDIVVNNFNDAPYYFRNQLPRNNYIEFRLKGTRSNRDAVGAVLKIQWGDKVMLRQVQAAGGYLSHSSKTVHFGLGEQREVEQVEITWPSGARQVLERPAINCLHQITELE